MSFKKKVLLCFLSLILMLAALELGLQLINLTKRFFQRSSEHQTLSLSPYKDKDWAKPYFEEFEVSHTTDYQSFYEWRRPEFHGQYINVLPGGIRKTWNPEFSDQQNFSTIYTFGGSTMWGTGARDDFTIPSLLSKNLNQNKSNYLVMNFGESGYTLTQEIIYLLLKLKQGEKPDYVIFYDGVNDIYAAYQSGQPGQIQNFKQRQKKMSSSSAFIRLKEAVLDLIKEKYLTYSAFQNLKSMNKKDNSIEGLTASEYNDQQLNDLAQEIVDDYLQNIEVIESLSRIHGFRYLMLWQPILYTNQAVTAEESGLSGWQDKQQIKLYRLVYNIMQNQQLNYFYNLASLLDSKEKTLFIDFHHLAEEGNKIIADRVYQLLQKEFSL
ncbi:SGNH/GDSL hydrolase family protein [Patescibacteria group bacterium]